KMEAILMFGMMGKTWSVVTRCLEDKELMEIAKKVGLERRWNNTQHQPGEVVLRILSYKVEDIVDIPV
ncbi:hypothetical protein A2U01_0109424, partial [Trifolium medium]|nr:hypothetical protein [Trifolium medium]